MIEYIISDSVLSAHGSWPVRSSLISTPKAYMSEAGEKDIFLRPSEFVNADFFLLCGNSSGAL